MPTYRVNVVVEYDYEVEADTLEEAEEQGWYYADHAYHADVYSIDVTEIPEDDENE